MLRYKLKPLADFVTAQGKTKQLYGVCFAYAEEFAERCEYIRSTVLRSDQTQSLDELIRSEPLIQESVRRCLELNGLSFSDISLRHLQDLLLFERDADKLIPGLLLRINTAQTQSDVEAEINSTDSSYSKVVAGLASAHCKTLSEAIELTTKLTSAELIAISKEAVELKLEQNASVAPPSSSDELTPADFNRLTEQLSKY